MQVLTQVQSQRKQRSGESITAGADLVSIFRRETEPQAFGKFDRAGFHINTGGNDHAAFLDRHFRRTNNHCLKYLPGVTLRSRVSGIIALSGVLYYVEGNQGE